MTTHTFTPEEERQIGWPIPVAHTGAVRYKVREFNERLAKRKNLDGRVEVRFEGSYTVGDPFDPEYGRKGTYAFLDITGVFRIEGYRFAGIYEFLPGVDRPTRQTFKDEDGKIDHPEPTDPRHCDHCGSRGLRKRIFVLQHEDGTFVSVGSTCLKDFTGYSPTQVLNVRRLVDEEFEEFFGGPITHHHVETEDLITTALQVIHLEGQFTPASQRGESQSLPTVDLALIAINDRGRFFKEINGFRLPEAWVNAEVAKKVKAGWKRIHDARAKAKGEVPEIIEWARNLKGRTDFELNLAIVAEAEYLGRRHWGLAAYIPEGYRRAQGQAKIEAKRRERPEPTEPVTEGKGLTLEGEIIGLKWQENYYVYNGADIPKVTVLLEDGNVVWGTLPEAGILPEVVGSKVRFVAEVKRSDRDRHFGFFKRPRRWETTELSEKGKEHAALENRVKAARESKDRLSKAVVNRLERQTDDHLARALGQEVR